MIGSIEQERFHLKDKKPFNVRLEKRGQRTPFRNFFCKETTHKVGCECLRKKIILFVNFEEKGKNVCLSSYKGK